MSLAEEITRQWLEGAAGRSGPFLSDLQRIILAVMEGRMESLSRENERLARQLERHERRLRRLDPERPGGTIIGDEG